MTIEIRAAVLTVSDRSARGERGDESGPVLAELLREAGAAVVVQEVVSDELEPLAAKLRELSDRADVNLVVTTGGTGLGPRDNTPEATRAVLEREVPGIPEAIRAETLGQTPTAMLSRAVSQLAGGDHK
jgi:molybdenum cofactor synthesis domain-containing protein